VRGKKFAPYVEARYTHPSTKSQKALKSRAQTGTPRCPWILFRYFENTMASSLANDQVKRELAIMLPMVAMNAATVIETIKTVAALCDPVA